MPEWRSGTNVFWLCSLCATVGWALAMMTVPSSPARAEKDPCAILLNASITVSAATINLEEPTTVNWVWHNDCNMSLRLFYRDLTSKVETPVSGPDIPLFGSLVDRPQSSGTYFLRSFLPDRHVDVGAASVIVTLPQVNGVTTVTIMQPNQNGLFAQAIATPHAVVHIAGNLDLDLSRMSNLTVANGVHILGDRTGRRLGPRLFTTTFPDLLLRIESPNDGTPGDAVRISGIRLDGGESDDPFSAVGTPDSDGIGVFSKQHVEIDHNEIFRWRGSAVNVHDGNVGDDAMFMNGQLNRDNADTVTVHDNYIHHNQHPSNDYCGESLFTGGHAAGYGVEASDGAFVKIEQNVFDWNRHSIAGDGKFGSGYLAFRNLILKHGGVHFRCVNQDDWTEVLAGAIVGLATGTPTGAIGGALDGYVLGDLLDDDGIYHTHAIDMHGRGKDCDYECGHAGEFMDIAFNTILYTAGNGIKLRGTPTSTEGMVVEHNVFAHSEHDGGAVLTGAMVQTETGLHDPGNNILGHDTFNERKHCDFDGDGIDDPFIATGVTLWFSSSVLGGRWQFLGQSPASLNEITLGDVDMDGRCEASAGGQVFHNLDPRPLARIPGTISTLFGRPTAVNLIATGGTRPFTWSVNGLPPGVSANSAGQISGNPAMGGASSYWVTATVHDAHQQVDSVTFPWTVNAIVPNLIGEQQKDVAITLKNAGLTQGRVSYANNCIDTGTVVTHAPREDTMVPVGSPVDVTISTCDSKDHGHGGGGGPILPK